MLTIQTGQNNPILRLKAKKVKKITPEIRELSFDMIKTMEAKDGLGLAAPQVGHSLRIIAIIYPTGSFALINPRIIRKSFKKEIMEEGCLSLPELRKDIKRSAKITVKALDVDGKQIKMVAEGLIARIIQHEVDHLNGILISDK